jgi:hypothetical protein
MTNKKRILPSVPPEDREKLNEGVDKTNYPVPLKFNDKVIGKYHGNGKCEITDSDAKELIEKLINVNIGISSRQANYMHVVEGSQFFGNLDMMINYVEFMINDPTLFPLSELLSTLKNTKKNGYELIKK